MAINSTDANYVNISSLPKSQVAADPDLIILQTDSGTKTIEFSDFNVVRTDAEGNATVVGNLTGNDVDLNNGLFSSSVSSVNFFSQGRQGINGLSDYYNRFTINSGLVTSATFVNNNSPDYRAITGTILPNLTSWLTSIYRIYIDVIGSVTLGPGAEFFNDSLNTTPYINMAAANFQNAHFNVTTTQRISSTPWVEILTWANNVLTFRVHLGYAAPAGGVTLQWRCLYPVASNQVPF